MLLLGAVLGSLLTGCERGPMINWDLSKSHTKADIGWKDDDPGREIEPVRSVRIVMPRGLVFEAKDDVRKVLATSEGDTVNEVTVTFKEQTAEDVVARAKELAKKLGFTDQGSFDRFLAGVHAVRADKRDESESDTKGSAGYPSGTKLAIDEPEVGLEILDSFDEKRPWLIDFGLSWLRGNAYTWDLSKSHTVADVGYFPKDKDQYTAPTITSLRLILPSGREFKVEGRQGEARLERKDQTITAVHTLFGEPSPEEAYERAVALAKEWGAPTGDLDTWLAEVNARKQKGEDGSKAPAVLGTRPPDTPGAPQIGVGLHYEEKDRLDLYRQPWVVDFEVRWLST